MSKTAVFIEMMSIQKYIFQSNKLKENIGASYIVENTFEELKKQNHSYIGGGNALLYFDSLEKAKNTMKKWTCGLLQKAPGLVPIVTIKENFIRGNYAESRKKIIKEAKKRENGFIPQTVLNSFGITADCPRSGLSAEVYAKKLPEDDYKYISSANHTKILSAEKADKKLQEDFSDIIGDDYAFPNELDKLGGSEGENSHIAVVHIDGNDLGEKFKNMKDEDEFKKLSSELKNSVINAFKDALKALIKKLPVLQQKGEISLKKNEDKNEFLPIRPIVIGGDDITFVCDARVGMFLATKFINSFENQETCKKNNVTACAGIAIVKTKYPFYRAYRMSQTLCSNAKQKRKKDKASSNSYIDFHISFGGLGGSLENIREKNYRSLDGNRLYERPYPAKNIPKLLACMQKMSETLPQSKVKKFREVLYEGETASKAFIKELKYRDIELPKFSHPDEKNKGFSNEETPYIDMIELIDFCPEILFCEEKANE